jgi:hypothetical protein
MGINSTTAYEPYTSTSFQKEPWDDEGEITYDNVEYPQHYTSGNIEVIDYIEDCCNQFKDGFVGFCLGNVIKYVSRHDKKNGIEDLKKAEWYLGKVIKYKEKK